MGRKKEKPKDFITPEEVITARLQRLAQREEINMFFQRLIGLLILLWVIFGFLFGITPMQNGDMVPKISAGDLMLYYRLEQDFLAQDVIVFEKEGISYTGRIVARGGDTVEITEDATLVVNGSTVWENEIYYTTPQYESDVKYPIALNSDEIFVLCDYREGAKDSRYFGPVRRDEIKGKVITVIRRSNL